MKNIVFVIALVLVTTSSFGQKVNFSGEWKINWEKSELGDQFSLAPNSLIVKHERKTIELERNHDFQGTEVITKDVLTLNGEECENTGWMDAVKKSTAVWGKKTKVMTITSNIQMEDGTDVEILEEIAMDGDNMVLESTASSDYGDLVERFVFDKQ